MRSIWWIAATVHNRLQEALDPQGSRDAMKTLRAGFLTHLHSDHVVDYPDILLCGWYSGIELAASSMRVLGPGRRGEMEPVFTPPGQQARKLGGSPPSQLYLCWGWEAVTCSSCLNDAGVPQPDLPATTQLLIAAPSNRNELAGRNVIRSYRRPRRSLPTLAREPFCLCRLWQFSFRRWNRPGPVRGSNVGQEELSDNLVVRAMDRRSILRGRTEREDRPVHRSYWVRAPLSTARCRYC
jgi:hypothetical protein